MPEPQRSTTYRNVERLIGEPLNVFILTARERGLSWTSIAHEVYLKTNVLVSYETLRQWGMTAAQEAEAAS